MEMVPTSTQSNPNVKRAVIAFQQPQARLLERGQYHTYKLCTTPADATSPIYKLSEVIKGQNVTQGPPSYAVAKTLLKGNRLTHFEQSMHSPKKPDRPRRVICEGIYGLWEE
eukprot:11443783-Ditylum_brightwellii.AAC.1